MTDRYRFLRHGFALAVLCALLGACTTGTVVLLPEKEGRPTAVSVTQGERVVVLDQPYAAAHASPFGPRAYVASTQEVEAQFGTALAAQPTRAKTFTLYFIEGKDEFTEESREVVDRILSEIAKRPVPDVLVVGHTDAVGSDQFNDALGLQRAEVVRAALLRLGIPPDDIHALSRGKRALAVPTADGVAEPRNRRVVIVVR
jgi:outer membrane protein OmpA-like peptidoglycan-associated protein